MKEIIIATLMRPSGETGVQTHFNCFSNYLLEQQISHQLITPFSYYNFLVYPVFAARKILDKLSGEMSIWWYRYWHAYFLRLALKSLLKKGEEGVIYTQCPLSADAALRARVSAKQKVFMVTHFNVSQADEWAGKGLIADGGRLFNSIRKFEATVLPKLDGLVFVSSFMQRALTKRIPAISKIASAVVPNFLSDPGLPESRLAVADLINIGTLEARKNQSYLLEILAALRKQGTPLTLTIIGAGPDRAKLEVKAQSLHVNDLLHFAGRIENAAEQIGNHKAYIHVATQESFGITLIEAMARARPVFAAPVGGISEVLGDGRVGLALPLDDAQTAARLISEAIHNQESMA